MTIRTPARIALRTASNSTEATPEFGLLAEAAMRWTYIVRKRDRWPSYAEATQALHGRAEDQLARLGIARPQAFDGGLVEAVISHADEESSWPARVMPWEFLLRAAYGQPNLAVVRRLRCEAPPRPTRPGLRFFSDGVECESERRLVEGTLGLPARSGGGVVHYNGENDLAEPETAIRLASEFDDASFAVLHAPSSGGRAASLCVAQGARAALGVQDSLPRESAERFLGLFYPQWRRCGWKLLPSFLRACRGGDGRELILWLADGVPANERFFTPTPRRAAPRQRLYIDVRPRREINYAALHNGDGLFDRFSLYKLDSKPLRDLRAEVELTSGVAAERLTYDASFSMDASDTVLDLARRVHLPLTSTFVRSLRESVVTSLRVRVTQGSEVLHADSARTTMLAVNEWRFGTPDSAWWLASFVLPGDPAVARVVEQARPGLRAISDDASAGFDGYQSPSADAQAQALWCELSFGRRISYINPPPVFTERSQRLRAPTELIATRHGTCIDLALLFAACLEYIDVYPVVFLFRDHAFGGFWRSLQAYRQYLDMAAAPAGGVEFDEVRRLVDEGALAPVETTLLTRAGGFRQAMEAGIDNLRSRDGWETLIDVQRARRRSITPLPILLDPLFAREVA